METYPKCPLKVFGISGEYLGDVPKNVDYEIIDLYGPTESLVTNGCKSLYKKYPSSIGNTLNNIKGYRISRKIYYGELFSKGSQK